MHFTVYGHPVPQGSKIAGQTKGGRLYVRSAAKGLDVWRTQVAQAAAAAMNGESLLDGPVMLELVFFLPRPKSHYLPKDRGLRRGAPSGPVSRPDVLKLARSVEDSLTGICYRDDAQIVLERLEKRYGEPLRCEVMLEWY